MLMFHPHPVRTAEFNESDSVKLAEGTDRGAAGVFIRLRFDVNWAEIRKRNGAVRCHPVAWLQHADPPGKNSEV